jgi:alkanesulfonate monooxygenase SsuD/methylene tetrahydromethanopterin reductase-like flavin-dependent oxidoreductase (luciferase family)
MHFGIEIIPFGSHSNPRQVMRLAQMAEQAGWEGVWIWDHMLIQWGAGDPWISLAAAAAVTSKIKLLLGVSPLPRYRPHLLARMLSGLDLLSQGRVIFGAGLGVGWDFAPFGEPAEDRTRAAMLDEGLELLTGYLSGEEVTHHGAYYHAEKVRLAPTPLQKPRIPIWIGGDSQPAFRRAARWDGWILGVIDDNAQVIRPPEAIAEKVRAIRPFRQSDTPFDVAVDGASAIGDSGTLAREYAEAGATWWFEGLYSLRGDQEFLEARIKAGPPGK